MWYNVYMEERMKKMMVMVFMVVSALSFAQNWEMINVFYCNYDKPTIVIQDSIWSSNCGGRWVAGQYTPSLDTITLDKDYLDGTVFLHEFTHYVIDVNKIDLKEYDEEYICYMVEYIYKLINNKDVISYKITGPGFEYIFERAKLEEYIQIFYKVFSK